MAWSRTSRHQRGYGTAWDKLRADILRREPLCRECDRKGIATPATDIDHITPKAKGGTDERENLQPLCKPCHKVKTAADSGHKPKQAIGADGWPVDG